MARNSETKLDRAHRNYTWLLTLSTFYHVCFAVQLDNECLQCTPFLILPWRAVCSVLSCRPDNNRRLLASIMFLLVEIGVLCIISKGLGTFLFLHIYETVVPVLPHTLSFSVIRQLKAKEDKRLENVHLSNISMWKTYLLFAFFILFLYDSLSSGVGLPSQLLKQPA